MVMLSKLVQNYVLNAALLSWVSAQVIKMLLVLFLTKRFVPERLFGAGGMPSAHSATVCALTISVARQCGYGSVEFAVTIVLAAIVMYDAMGVRRSAGEQAKVLNKINEQARQKEKEPLISKELKEFLGHTPFEVLCGALLGILIAMLVPM